MMSNPDKPQSESARRLIAGALGDFLTHLIKLPDPLIVGGQYTSDRLLAIYAEWCRIRGFDCQDPDVATWLQLCGGGHLRSAPEAPQLPLQSLEGPGSRKPRPKPKSPPRPPKKPKNLDAGNDTDILDHGYEDRPKGKRQSWESEGESWKDGEPEEGDDNDIQPA